MEFFIAEELGRSSLRFYPQIPDVKDQHEAISKAREHAQNRAESSTVGVYMLDSDGVPHPIDGWTVLRNGKLRREPLDAIERKFPEVRTLN